MRHPVTKRTLYHYNASPLEMAVSFKHKELSQVKKSWTDEEIDITVNRHQRNSICICLRQHPAPDMNPYIYITPDDHGEEIRKRVRERDDPDNEGHPTRLCH